VGFPSQSVTVVLKGVPNMGRRKAALETEPPDADTVYWICPPRSLDVKVPRVRHATTRKPGSLVHGRTITSIGGCLLKIPLATPNDRVPDSKHIQDCCPDCAKAANRLQVRQVLWDY
jgi:hypothetical protein